VVTSDFVKKGKGRDQEILEKHLGNTKKKGGGYNENHTRKMYAIRIGRVESRRKKRFEVGCVGAYGKGGRKTGMERC